MQNESLSLAEVSEIENHVLEGALERASLLAYIFGICGALYGLTSLRFIQYFDSSVTLWGNLWPRFLISSVPFVSMGYIISKKVQLSPKNRILIWVFGMPLIVMFSCFINVWEIMARGSGDIVLYAHGINIFIITSSIMAVSASPKLNFTQMIIFYLMIFLPIEFMLYRSENWLLMIATLGDLSMVFPVVLLIGNAIYKLRY